MTTAHITMDMPRSVLAALRKEPEAFVREMRLAAAIKWYELELGSQSKAAEISGLSHADFLMAPDRYRASRSRPHRTRSLPSWRMSER